MERRSPFCVVIETSNQPKTVHKNENNNSVTGSGFVVQAKSEKIFIKGIIYLTSDKFSTFAGVIAALMSYIGVFLDDNHIIAYGAIVWLIGFMPWAFRQSARDIRQDKLGLNNDKW